MKTLVVLTGLLSFCCDGNATWIQCTSTDGDKKTVFPVFEGLLTRQAFKTIHDKYGPVPNVSCNEVRSATDTTVVMPGDRRRAEDEAFNKQRAAQLALLDQRRELVKKRREAYGSPLRDLTAGEYLDAIYIGDIDEVRRIDQAYFADIRAQFQQLKSSPIGKLFSEIDLDKATLVVPTMREYLRNYSAQYSGCLKPDAVAFTIQTTVTNGYGVQQGQTDTVYRINREFAEAFKASGELPNQSGLSDLGDAAKGGAIARVAIGVDQMMSRFRCDSPLVARFETNLLDMYWKITAPQK